MKFHFYKYQSAGNHFVLFDNRNRQCCFSKAQVMRICQPGVGIGADGIILVEEDSELHFSAVYFNRDASQTLCCNGYRAAVLFALKIGIIQGYTTTFRGQGGAYSAELLPSNKVKLKMPILSKVEKIGLDYFVETGVPHYVTVVKDIKEYPVVEEGRRIRFSKRFQPNGINVNFVELLKDNSIFVRTFERGVEDETLSCATGTVAAAAVAYCNGYSFPMVVKTRGGDLLIDIQLHSYPFRSEQNLISANIYHIGPVSFVFEGEFEL